jgi:hypothetical protein
MSNARAVVGVFTYLDDIISAIEKVKNKGASYRVYAPTFVHELDEHIDETRSPVALMTATGGVLGLAGGFALAILCGLDWPLRVSAKEIVAVPGYFVIGYECTILIGAIATLLGLLHFCRLPDIVRKVGYDPRFSLDKFGLVIDCASSEVADMSQLLADSGADEVKEEDGL